MAARVERELGIPVLRHSEKKPAGSAADLEAFFGCVHVCSLLSSFSVQKCRLLPLVMPARGQPFVSCVLIVLIHMYWLLCRCLANRLVMVGDRYLTDIVYGNKNGMLTVHCSALSTEGEPTTVGLARMVEERYIGKWRSRGIAPPQHSLLPSEEILASFRHPVVDEPGTAASDNVLAS